MTEQVLEQRAALQEVAAGRTVCDALAVAADSWPDRPAYSDRDGGPGSSWQTISWARTRQLSRELAAGLVALGLQPGERVALMLPNRVEHVLADQAALHAGGVPVTFYPTDRKSVV